MSEAVKNDLITVDYKFIEYALYDKTAKAAVTLLPPHCGVDSDTGKEVELYWWRHMDSWYLKDSLFIFCMCEVCAPIERKKRGL